MQLRTPKDCTRAFVAGRSATLLSALVVLASAHSAAAAGVVGTGTAASCTEGVLNAALSGGGLVTFNCGDAATIPLTTSKTILADTIIDGGGLITISGVHRVNVFKNTVQRNFTVRNLTIADGVGGAEDDYAGGGVYNDEGTLLVSNCAFSNNHSVLGGAIYNNGRGMVTVTNSTFSGNTAADAGGGIAASHRNGGGTVTVAGSTFSGNTAPSGGGIYNSRNGTLTITNSTFSGNRGEHGGGAIANYFDGVLTVTNSTFAANSAYAVGGGIAYDGDSTVSISNSTFDGNSASVGGGIANASYNSDGSATLTNCTLAGNGAGVGGGAIFNASTLTLINTIVADSTRGRNCTDTATDGGHNLDSDGSCGIGPATPVLLDAGLKNNGGSTQTIALQIASPAINAGDESVCLQPPINNLDQRGYERPGGMSVRCSIGAFEYDAVPARITCTGDCDGSGAVDVNEIIMLVSIALGTQGVVDCPQGVAVSLTNVTIAIIIQAVNHALSGCSR